MAEKGIPLERNWISSNKNSKQRQEYSWTQQNSRCRLCSDRDETINHIISESCKLAQKVTHQQESALENETHKIL